MSELYGLPVTELPADVLVVGGGPAASWAAMGAVAQGAKVVVVDKGYLGTSGATAPSTTGVWYSTSEQATQEYIDRRIAKGHGLCEPDRIRDVVETASHHIDLLAERGYDFPTTDEGKPFRASLRGPDYMAFMRRQLLRAGVTILDHHPALELWMEDGRVVGASGFARQKASAWKVSAGSTVLATGGCAFGDLILGATGLTGDGYLMAGEAGARFSGMEFSAQYGLAPLNSAVNKGLIYTWATFTREDGSEIEITGERYEDVARAALHGPVYALLDKAKARSDLQDWLRRGQPNIFVPLDRNGVDPFSERYQVFFRCEGTVRGTGGVMADKDCWTGVEGLYAAGDTLDRQKLAGATTGGGGPNAAWAISTGVWSGTAAARSAKRHGRAILRSTRLGRVGIRPEARGDISAADIRTGVQHEMLPLDRNFFRRTNRLVHSKSELDHLWAHAKVGLEGAGLDALRSREAAAMLATARLCYGAALQRPERRGIHRLEDHPKDRDGFDIPIEISDIEGTRFSGLPDAIREAA